MKTSEFVELVTRSSPFAAAMTFTLLAQKVSLKSLSYDEKSRLARKMKGLKPYVELLSEGFAELLDDGPPGWKREAALDLLKELKENEDGR